MASFCVIKQEKTPPLSSSPEARGVLATTNSHPALVELSYHLEMMVESSLEIWYNTIKLNDSSFLELIHTRYSNERYQMSTVRHILLQKGNEIWTTTPETVVFDALSLMAEKNIGALLVSHQGNPVGIFSERDYARKVVLKGKSSRDILVSEIMTDRVVYIGLDKTADESLALMTDKKVRHLPVLENQKLVGLISIGDVVKAIISDKDFTIEQLESYIAGIG